ncbi:hypothetical protein Dsin_015342 [Dipteronia sinensis]|uniref:Uncharacterized protein n=1 Tax=Dipteronia sinensis TaxID=43782 RepID=A0AAE0E4G6_9ROSI|nr:hypothetical protein Dsin_015342 [Dipteronia sinensis]
MAFLKQEFYLIMVSVWNILRGRRQVASRKPKQTESGIGSHEHLKKFNISVKVGLEDVGHGIKDNPSIAVLVETMPAKRQPESPGTNPMATVKEGES